VTVVFDAEPLLAFSFDEQGAGEVERWLDRVYDGERDGYISTINLAEFRYIAIRESSVEQTDAHIDDLRDMGVTEYDIDELWVVASEIKATYSPSIGDAYAVATARELDNDGRDVTLLVGADDDYDVFEDREGFEHLIERFRDVSS
jgi:predicted nucleic acid-binding protein